MECVSDACDVIAKMLAIQSPKENMNNAAAKAVLMPLGHEKKEGNSMSKPNTMTIRKWSNCGEFASFIAYETQEFHKMRSKDLTTRDYERIYHIPESWTAICSNNLYSDFPDYTLHSGFIGERYHQTYDRKKVYIRRTNRQEISISIDIDSFTRDLIPKTYSDGIHTGEEVNKLIRENKTKKEREDPFYSHIFVKFQ